MNNTVPFDGLESGADHGRGLWLRDGIVTNLPVRLAGRPRIGVKDQGDKKPGSGLITTATTMLFGLAVALFAVSINAQYRYIFGIKGASVVSWTEAIALDAGMSIFSLLALGLARAGKSARIERFLIMVCAIGSAGMNFAAANDASPKSVVAYIMPPVFLAIVVDRVIAVIRRHVIGEDEQSPWAPVGRAIRAVARFGFRALLYSLRFMIARRDTWEGAKQALLIATPLPEPVKYAEPGATVPAVIALPKLGPVQAVAAKPVPSIEQRKRPQAKPRARKSGPSKTSAFLDLVIAERGELAAIDLGQVYTLAKTYAPKVGLHEGSARTALRAAIQRAGAR